MRNDATCVAHPKLCQLLFSFSRPSNDVRIFKWNLQHTRCDNWSLIHVEFPTLHHNMKVLEKWQKKLKGHLAWRTVKQNKIFSSICNMHVKWDDENLSFLIWQQKQIQIWLSPAFNFFLSFFQYFHVVMQCGKFYMN